MRLLVTGATGRIGTQIVRDIASSTDCWTTARTDLSRTKHVTADLTIAAEVASLIDEAKPDTIIHLAGSVGPDPSRLIESNIMGTVNLIHEVKPGTRVVVVGSAAEYGAPTTTLASEDTATNPVNAYGWSKVAQTRLARNIGVRRGIEIVVARPFNVVSPNMARTTPVGNIAHQIIAHEGPGPLGLVAGRLDVVRDFVPVTFVSEALRCIALTDSVTDTYNICSGHGFTLLELVDSMASLRNVEIAIELDPNLASIPAVDGIVGNPQRIASLLGEGWKPSIAVLASIALDRGET